MRHFVLRSMMCSSTLAISLALNSPAYAYPIDCAILLCLAGGFPPSAECATAKAVFIRRITPFPIEPPLQIWNCPMGVTAPETQRPQPRVYEATYRDYDGIPPSKPSLTDTLWGRRAVGLRIGGSFIVPAQSYPSGDIADPVYDFVRTIRVWHIDYRQNKERDHCMRDDRSRVGGYGLQGNYAWGSHDLREASIIRTKPTIDSREGAQIVSYSWNAPAQASIHQESASSCGEFVYRAVVVTWQDYFGESGFHEVRY